MRLYAEKVSGQAMRYELTETYLDTRDGDRTFESGGRWTIMRGTPDNNDATVYQLDFDRPGRERNFLRVGDAELRMLDRDQRKVPPAMPNSLQRIADPVASITLGEGDAGKSVEVERGQSVVVRLDTNCSTGYGWTFVDPDSPVLTRDGDAVCQRRATDGSIGDGGTETWSFVVANYGVQELIFEYRRPWESDQPPARRVTYTVLAAR
jgi:predicted secreted protein